MLPIDPESRANRKLSVRLADQYRQNALAVTEWTVSGLLECGIGELFLEPYAMFN